MRYDGALVIRGPYRLLSHPNYLIVTGALAIAFDAPVIAATFSAANATVLIRRVRPERAALGASTDL